MPFRLILFLCSFSVLAGCALNQAGNQEGYEGGDPPTASLEQARTIVVRAAHQVKGGISAERICEARACDGETTPFCTQVANFSENQRAQCRSYLNGAMPLVLERLEGARPIALLVQSKSFIVEDQPGVPIEVAARTKPDEVSPLFFSRPLIGQLSTYELVAVLFHELGHKISLPGFSPYLRDETEGGAFATGRDFLNALGAAFALYAYEMAPEGEDLGSPSRLFRSYDLSLNAHFFTASEPEHQTVVARGYRDENYLSTVFTYARESKRTKALFRLYHPVSGFHRSTTSRAERDEWILQGWKYEGVLGYLLAAQESGSREVFRLFNNVNGAYFLTASAAEKDTIIAGNGGAWVLDKVLGFSPLP